LEGEPARAAGGVSKAPGRARCGSSPPPSSMEGAPPARQRALNARAGSLPGDRHFHLPLAATQPVDGAALIRRYRSVQLRGGQLVITLRWSSGYLTWPSTKRMPVRPRHGARTARPCRLWVGSGVFTPRNGVRVSVGLQRVGGVRSPRLAHNQEDAGSNPAPATKSRCSPRSAKRGAAPSGIR
jgi:hypothetical protein